MQKESSGIELAPKRSKVIDLKDDLIICFNIFEEVTAIASKSVISRDRSELLRCLSRLIHVQSRLERLFPTEPDSVDEVNALLDSIYAE